jgi:hypothetical protein
MITPERSFAFENIEDLELLLSYQGPRNPSDAEWAPYVALLQRLHATRAGYRYLVFSDGGHPSSEQQARLKAATEGRKPPVSIISSSVAIRFVVSIFALFNHRVQCFAPSEINSALRHIGLNPDVAPRVLARLAKLKDGIAAPTEAA